MALAACATWRSWRSPACRQQIASAEVGRCARTLRPRRGLQRASRRSNVRTQGAHTDVASEPQLTTGDEIAGYTLESLIGRGGMGEVFRAVDGRLARAVALKVLAPELVHDEAFRDRILRESQLAASIDHPNVIPVYAAGEADGHVYIAMRLVEGSDLRSRAAARRAPRAARAVGLARAGGLGARRRARPRPRPPRRQAEQRPDRRAAAVASTAISRTSASRRRSTTAARRSSRSGCWARSPTSRPSRSAAIRSDARADVYSLGCLVVRVPHRRGAVRPRLRHRGRVRAPRGAAAEAERASPGASARARCGDRPRAREGSGRPPGELRRARRRGAPRARAGRAAASQTRAPRRARARGRRARRGAIAWARALRSGAGAARDRIGRPHRRGERNREGALPACRRIRRRSRSEPRVWVADYRQGTLWRIDQRTGAVNSIPAIGNPRALAILGGRVYVGSDGPSLLRRQRHALRRAHRRPHRRTSNVVPCSVAAGLGVVYSAGCPNVQRLEHRREVRGRPQTVIPLPEPPTAEHVRNSLFGMAIGEGAVWAIGDALDHRLFKIAPRSGRLLATYALPITPQRIAAGAGAVWITDAIHDVLVKFDPAERPGRAADRHLAGAPTASRSARAASGSRARSTAQVARIDPATRPHRRAHRRGHGAARAGGGAERGLGDARCDLAACRLALAGVAAALVALVVGLRRRVGRAVPDRRPGGLHRHRRRDARLVARGRGAAAAPARRRARRQGPRGRRARREGRPVALSRSSRAARRRASSAG